MRSGEGRGEASGDEQRDDDLDESLRMDDRLTGPRLSCWAASWGSESFTGLLMISSIGATDGVTDDCEETKFCV